MTTRKKAKYSYSASYVRNLRKIIEEKKKHIIELNLELKKMNPKRLKLYKGIRNGVHIL